jgi:hypothetical protein
VAARGPTWPADAWAGTVRTQRKPRNPKTNKMITTAPTIQTILFMMPFLSCSEANRAVCAGHLRSHAQSILKQPPQRFCALVNIGAQTCHVRE